MKIFITLGLLLISTFGFANSHPYTTRGQWFIQAGIGTSWTQKPSDAYLISDNLMPPDLYRSRKKYNELLETVGLGYIFKLNRALFFPTLALSINYNLGAFGNNRGDIYEFNDPQQLNYNYRYNIIRHAIMFNAKLTLIRTRITPFVVGGAGIAFNIANSYIETRKLDNILPRQPINFRHKTTRCFAWLVGAGLSWSINKNWGTSLEYRYNNVGRVGLGYANGIKGPQQKLHLNSIVAKLWYIFD